MKRLILTITLLTFLALPALASKTVIESTDHSERVECGFACTCWVWAGDYYVETCDAGGAAVWQYGTVSNPEVPATDCDGNPLGDVLGTVLNTDYFNDSGERVVLMPAFTVGPDCNLLEICHFFDIENNYDGGNVELIVGGNPVVITPTGGYTHPEISTSTSFYAWCVDGQPGFSDGPTGFTRDCFDLSDYMGETVNVAFKFGSDSSVTYPGWYISDVVVGSLVTSTEDTGWSTLKALY